MARATRPLRRRQELTPADLANIPVWEFTLREKTTGPNEGEVRGRLDLAANPPVASVNGLAVRSTFVLANGRTMTGVCDPTVAGYEDWLGYVQPTIVTDEGQVHFWRLGMPTAEQLARDYRLLGSEALGVFPVSFASDVPVADDQVASGTLEGFGYIEERVTNIRGSRRFEFVTGETT
jgi:hypothetical protein